ncbi:uncharacterized protein A4U43_C08F19250 [Asparagus officinalis]|uniref:heat stress transcription factor A-2e-like n=1 Tax=Asparagus officinalis TaxID=4686 RepID=UPI00098DF15C|nr:heat stress transcription factor A-2e-like [Asparagus officinalis]ONK60510.1 uncharacterized protein A4U43_C08F19250 [Asparagus officinalis]
MDPLPAEVKVEYSDGPSAAPPPRPKEGLYEVGPPPFLTKTYEMVDDQSTVGIVSWSGASNSFVVWDPHAFSMTILPRYFKHSNFSSFVRQLNTYGFRKVDPDKWEFANERFLRGQKHLLKTIRRRKAPPNPPHQLQSLGSSLEIGRYALDGEIGGLKRDKNILMNEVIKLRQEQQNTRAHLQAMEERLKGTEQKQQQMMTFLAKAMQNPNLLQQFAQKEQHRKELEEAINKKRRRRIEFRPDDVEPVLELEGEGLKDLYQFEGSELESLTIGREALENDGEVIEDVEEESGELNDDFWEELLNEGIGRD